jgi:hypothetical protein
MTRDQIAADLLDLVVRIGNELPADVHDLPADVRAAEWAYVKGLAGHEILQLRDRLLTLSAGASLAAVLEQSGGPSRRRSSTSDAAGSE